MSDRLVCTRPNATVDFEYQGGTFKIGILPRSIYAEFVEAGSKQLKGKMNGADMLDLQFKIIKHSVKGHSGLVFSDGSEVPYNQDDKGLVAADTLDIYYSTGLLPDLFNRVVTGGDNASPKEQSAE